MALHLTPPGETADAQALCGKARDAMAQRTVMRVRGRPLTEMIVMHEDDLALLVQWAEYAVAMHKAKERA